MMYSNEFYSPENYKTILSIPKRENVSTLKNRLLEKRSQMVALEETIEDEKENFKLKMESLKDREKWVKSKQIELKYALFRSENFIKENRIKHVKAVERTQHGIHLQNVFTEQIFKLEKEQSELTIMKNVLKKKVSDYKKFSDFIQDALETSFGYTQTLQIVNRYETLSWNLNFLIKKKDEDDETLTQNLRDLNGSSERFLKLLNLGNALNKLRIKLELAQLRKIRAEYDLKKIQHNATGNKLVYGKTRMAIRNIYELLLRRRGQPSDASHDTLKQLSVIKIEIEKLNWLQKKFHIDLSGKVKR